MQIQNKKIVAVHLLNDFSGSPLVFTQALEGLQKAGYEVVLHTSAGREGFLNRVKCKVNYFPYQFYSNTILRLLAFTFSQFFVFAQLLRYRKQDVTIYVNTLLPFGAALAGKIMGKPVIYHLHESYIRPAIFKKFLRFIASHTAKTALYVSNYLEEVEHLEGVKSQVVYNALPDEFVKESEGFKYHPVQSGQFNVLMICSLKTYKGVYEFVSLASRHPYLHFELVLNASDEEVHEFFIEYELPGNLTVFSTQKNLHPFYKRASLVVNLTNPCLCIETFGITLLEAMCYGIPVIAPPVGGPTEFVEAGNNGITIDVRRITELDEAIDALAKEPERCEKLSKGALLTAGRFQSSVLQNQVLSAIQSL
jgi:L-malate glycosyltransferase